MATAVTHCAIRNSRVLIASSNEAFRRQWIVDPENVAVDVEEAAGGADALAKLESANWGEILLDRRLHDLDVNEVLHIIRARHPHLLVRLVDSEVREQVREIDAAGASEAVDVLSVSQTGRATEDLPQTSLLDAVAISETCENVVQERNSRV